MLRCVVLFEEICLMDELKILVVMVDVCGIVIVVL